MFSLTPHLVQEIPRISQSPNIMFCKENLQKEDLGENTND